MPQHGCLISFILPLLLLIRHSLAFPDPSTAESGGSPSISQQHNKWEPNTYTPNFGVYIGPLRDIGHVFAVNESAVICVNCTFAGDVADTFFWLDRSEVPTRDGVRLSTFEYGLSPLGPLRPSRPVLLILPESLEDDQQYRLSDFQSLSLYSLNGDVSLGMVRIPENLVVPRSHLLPDELRGNRYDVQSGPIQILDTRTIKIYGFTFQGDKAPDGYFYVGRGLNVSREAGVKVVIRGHDTPDRILPMNERYTGGKDIFLELPEGYDIYHIDWLSVYCVRFEVNYGHIFIRNISPMIPPYVPAPKRFEEELEAHRDEQWHMSNLLGTASQLNFTFQLGPPGGNRGYKTMVSVTRPPKYVWYVNGYIAELYLRRGVTYNFIIEGGHNATVSELHNPLYLTDSPYGGYSKLSNEEKQRVRKFSHEKTGRLCRWTETKLDIHPDEFGTFVDFRDTLMLECDENDQPGLMTFTPSQDTPDTLYFGSYSNYQMGGKIHVVNEFPADLKHIVAESIPKGALEFLGKISYQIHRKKKPYRYDARRHQESLELSRDNSALSRSRTWPLLLATIFSSSLFIFLI